MRKSVKELLIFIVIFIFLHVSGLLPEVLGAVQRAVLFTGIMNPDVEEVAEPKKAEYNFELQTLGGETVNFQSYKGKVIFLNLWASWCGPCIAEMPNIQALYEKTASEDIVFVMLSLDDSPEKAAEFIERKDYTFPVFTPANGIPSVYTSGSIPTTHVISSEGEIIFSHKGTANYDTKKFRKLLNKHVPQ